MPRDDTPLPKPPGTSHLPANGYGKTQFVAVSVSATGTKHALGVGVSNQLMNWETGAVQGAIATRRSQSSALLVQLRVDQVATAPCTAP